MFSALPDLTPRDSHSLWYISSRDSYASARPEHHDADPNNPLGPHARRPPGPANGPLGGGAAAANHSSAATVERSALARLLADEQYMERRRQNVRNFGSAWLRPPGVPKTLYQMREERREAEEHAEAMRREQLAQQLADAAEAEAAAAAAGGGPSEVDDEMAGLEEGDIGGDGDGEGMRDLDDEIPEAEGFGFDGVDSDDEDEDDDSDDDDDDDRDDNDDADDGGGAGIGSAQAQREMRTQLRNMRATEDRVREILARGQGGGEPDVYGAEDDDLDEEDRAQMLEEDDLVQHHHHGGGGLTDVESGMDMDMDADLDDDVPEAESAGYEHTDTEAELSSSEDGSQDVNYGARAPQAASRFRGGFHRSSIQSGRGSLPRSEIDISSILSRDGSSVPGSSPQVRRRNQ
ncbi:hypothetical protein NKR23_g7588 [Pleurostoma richardsiae]|uniref:Uncharacterized protein n=1 Tax=Pleurostoma richardsiae TaxID=41990 RepID=A0AA38RT34_9PEZI|nr:hypothetical protein NKR23_g7588 [Pleurostoma richardsiae]